MNKMKYLLIGFLAFIQTLVFGQQKGATIIQSEKQNGERGNTYAVVVGISDYQDPGIPDLRFADKDAEAFANYLRSDAGGRLDDDHLKVLINQKATMAQFANALDWLWEVCKEGDHAIIYFSGHGDVEKKSLSQPGFLLCWDAPARVYMAGGAFALPMLQEVISTLSIQNKAKVIVVTDACHSGKLAGSSVGGSQATTANLAKQFGNEIKIMSCQPDEYSIEGEQWGGGRGAFSFHLIDALYGLADANNDHWVSLQEVGRYLEDHVGSEVAPVSQVPMIIGNRNEQLSIVNTNLLTAIKLGKTNQTIMLSSIESRGIEEDVLAGVDTSIRKVYQLFQTALRDKIFLEPKNACADFYYNKLIKETKLSKLHSAMRRNYAAALQDEAQQTLNSWLRNSQDIFFENVNNDRLPQQLFTEKVKTYPRSLDRAAELLGEKHYMYATLKARKFFFEGYILANSNNNPNPEMGRNALKLFRKSLDWVSDQPQIYWQMSHVFGYNFLQTDSLEYYSLRALELYPNWTRPCTDAAFWLSFKNKQQDRAKLFLEKANLIDSNSVDVLHYWAIFNFGQKNYTKAEEQLKKVIAMDSSNVFVWNNLGYYYLLIHRLDQAEVALKKAIALDSTHAQAWNNLGACYNQNRRFDLAEVVLQRAILLDSTLINAWNNLGNCYNQTRHFDKAEAVLKTAILLDSTHAHAWNNLGVCYNLSRRYYEAEPVLKKAILLDSTNASAWNNLGNCYLQTFRYTEAEPVLKKAIKLDSSNFFAWNNLGYCYLQTNQYNLAEIALKKAIYLDATIANPFKHLGMVYFKTNRLVESRTNFNKAIELNPNYAAAILGIVYVLQSEGKTSEALQFVEQAISKGSSFDQLAKDEDLEFLRTLLEWKVLMRKYFPEQFKDK